MPRFWATGSSHHDRQKGRSPGAEIDIGSNPIREKKGNCCTVDSDSVAAANPSLFYDLILSVENRLKSEFPLTTSSGRLLVSWAT